MKTEIKHRITRAVLDTTEVDDTDENPVRTALVRAVASDCSLCGANLRDADLSRADLSDANLVDADLSRADLRDANLVDANLRDANLVDANLRGADLTGANLRGADLTGANLGGANLEGAYLSRADLRGANLRYADLGGANLVGANLERANLVGANLVGADLCGANLERARDDLRAVLDAAPVEELRAGVEEILGQGHESAENMHCHLRRLLDRIDARDSLAHLEVTELLVAEQSENLRLQQQLIALSADNRDLRLQSAFARSMATIAGKTPDQFEAEYQAWRSDGVVP